MIAAEEFKEEKLERLVFSEGASTVLEIDPDKSYEMKN